MTKRVRFDDLVAELGRLGCESWDDLTKANRARLVVLYFSEYPEWSDALYENMEHVFDAYEHHDHADFGLAVAQKMASYVKPYINKQLAYRALCRREQEQIA